MNIQKNVLKNLSQDKFPDHLPEDLWEVLCGELTDSRREKLLQVSQNRTELIRLVIQDVHNPHNVSACLRSAEAFGVLHADIVTLKNPFKPSTASRGVTDWLQLHKFTDIATCALELKKSGYKLAAAVRPGKHTINLQELPCQEPIALIFGNEHEGISQEWDSHIDYSFTIPMFGMVESLNISVAAAICLHTLTEKFRSLRSDDFFLNSKARSELLNRWIAQQYAHWPLLYKRLS